MSNDKNLDQYLDDLLSAVELPTDESINKETGARKQNMDPRVREKRAEGNKKFVEQNPQTRKERSDRQKHAWSNQEKRQKRIENIKKSRNTESVEERFNKARLQKNSLEWQEANKKGVEKRSKNKQWKQNQFKATQENNRVVKTPAGTFKSLNDACQYHDISLQGMYYRMKTKSDQFFFVDGKGIGRDTFKVITDDGTFESIKEAAQFYQISEPAMRGRIKKYPEQFKKVKK